MLSVLLLSSLPARADIDPNWSKLPDGRVVVDLYGVRLAFDPNDPDLVNNATVTQGNPAYFEKFDDGDGVRLTVQQALVDRAQAAAFFASAQNGISLVMPLHDASQKRSSTDIVRLPPPDRLFLGRFRFSTLRAANLRSLIVSFDKAPRQVERLKLPYPYLDVKEGPDQFGITSYKPSDRGKLVPGGGYNATTLFQIPHRLRLLPGDQDLLFICSYFNICTFFEASTDRRVRFSYDWSASKDWRVENLRTSSSWIRLDDTIRRLVATIAIDYQPQDFQ